MSFDAKERGADSQIAGAARLAQARSAPASPLEAVRLAAEREHGILSILELTRELTASHDPHAIADLLLLTLMGQFAAPKAALWLVSPENPELLVLLRSYGLPRRSALAVGRSFGAPDVREALIRRGGLDGADLVARLAEADREGIEEVRLALFAPILVQDVFKGVLGLGPRVGGLSYGSVDLSILQSSLGIVGVTLENTSLYNNLMERNRHLRHLTDELRQFDDAKSEFLRNVNHELRTPLTIIIGYLELLLSDQFDSDRREDVLEVMMEQSTKLTVLLEKLLSECRSDDHEFPSAAKHAAGAGDGDGRGGFDPRGL
jgi:GAF domain-containing protein